MIFQWYPAGGGGAILANLWTANPMSLALLKPTHVPDPDTHKVWADISASELAASGGYTAGGIALTGKSTVYTAASDRYDFLANDVSWGPPATFDAAFAVVYDNSGSKPLWALANFEGTKSVANGTFNVDFQATGVLYVTIVP